VNVKIDVPGRNNAVAKVKQRNAGRKPPAALRRNFQDAPIVDKQERMLDRIRRSQQPSSSKCQHRNVLIKEKEKLSPRL